MRHMSLRKIAAACGGTYIGPDALKDREVSSVVIDSRKVEKDSLFVAMRGSRVDGHRFIPQTIQNGALGALSEDDLGETDFPYILVASCPQALKDLAEYYRKTLSVQVVGISGSVGKTSTKEMVASILSQKYKVLKTEGNFNNEIGLPLTIFQIREEHEIAVLEMGISHFGEMTRLAKMARPDICILTNIGCAHIEHLQSRDGILKAKTEMLAYMNPQGTLLLNGDDDKLASYIPENGVKPTLFGCSEHCSFRAEQVTDQGLRGTSAVFVTPNSRFSAQISIPGEHMVLNALAGTAAGYAFGLSDEEIKNGIEALVPLSGRNRLIETNTFSIIDDCYNANPVSMKASLDVLAKAEMRTVAILGDMFELGDTTEELHFDTGRYAAQIGIQVLICIGALGRQIAQGAASASHTDQGDHTAKTSAPEIHHYETKADFFAEMNDVLTPGDTILVKASHGMNFAEIVTVLEETCS